MEIEKKTVSKGNDYIRALKDVQGKDPSGISNIIFKHNIASENLLGAEQMPTGIFCLTTFTVFITQYKKFKKQFILVLMFSEFPQREHILQH